MESITLVQFTYRGNIKTQARMKRKRFQLKKLLDTKVANVVEKIANLK